MNPSSFQGFPEQVGKIATSGEVAVRDFVNDPEIKIEGILQGGTAKGARAPQVLAFLIHGGSMQKGLWFVDMDGRRQRKAHRDRTGLTLRARL